ncbi:MAG: hypothetical protein ACKPEQ_07515, partial [Dolichospermum sp.]
LAAIQEAIKTTIPATLPAVIQEAVKPLTEQIEVIEKQQRDVRKLVDTMPESSAKLSEQMASWIAARISGSNGINQI